MKASKFFGVAACSFVLLLSACVTVEESGRGEIAAGARSSDSLIVARIGDAAILSWQAAVGNEYTILYADGRRSSVTWQPLPGATRIRGTGREMRIEDQAPPGITRYYRLMIDSPRR